MSGRGSGPTRWAFVFAVALFSVRVAPIGAELRIGFSEAEITPPLGAPMAGYAARIGSAESIHDPLSIQAVVLGDGERRIALVALDLRRLASERVIETLRTDGIEHVILASSHTHSGPNAEDERFRGSAGLWRAELEDRVIETVRRAAAETFSARLQAGRGAVKLAHNRRLVKDDGTVTMLWRNAEERPTKPLDSGIGVVRVSDTSGTTRGVLVHFACHPVVLGPDNLAISADYPGAMRRRLRETAVPQSDPPFVVFLQGAAGDLNPFRDKQPVAEGGFEEMERVGALLADAVSDVLLRLKERPAVSDGLRVATRDMVFDHRWQKNQKVELRVTTVLLGEQLALVAMPGEPFVGHQLELSARSPVPISLLLGYAVSGGHAWPGYVPTLPAAVAGGYGADYNTHIEVGAGEAMVDAAIVDLYSLLGWLDADL